MTRLLRRNTKTETDKHIPLRCILGLVGLCAVIWGAQPKELLEIVDTINNGNRYFDVTGNNNNRNSVSERNLHKDGPPSFPCNCETKCNSTNSSHVPTIKMASGISNSSNVKTMRWNDWPAVAYEEVGHSLVTKGDNIFHHAKELYLRPPSLDHGNNNAEQTTTTKTTLLEEFLAVYKARPDPVNLCGIRINHAMALFLAVKMIQPTLVVESGVNQGISTYFIRAASSTTKIFAIDPEEKPICNQGERWIDSSELTNNLTGPKFVDLLALDWKGMIDRKEVDPERTLVFIDDHLHAFERIAAVWRHGVRHVIIEDNYKPREGATIRDRKSTPKQYFRLGKFRTEANWLFRNMKSYAEFPPLIPPIMAKLNKIERKKAGGFMVASDHNEDIVHPMLRPDTNEEDLKLYNRIASELGLDPKIQDTDSYMQFMNYNQICYLELLPVPRTLLE